MEFDWQYFTQFVIIGVATGALVALIALGYTLVYGIIELINFAHGEVFMMGAFFATTFVTATGVTNDSSGRTILLTIFAGLILSMIFSALLNAGIDQIAYRRLRNAPRLAPLIAAIGVSFILQNIGIYWHGSNPFTPPNIIPTDYRSYNILREWFDLDTTIRFRLLDLFVIGTTIPLLILLSWFVYRTRMGTAMRATAQDREAAALMGINIDLTITLTFLIGGALAGAAGLIYGLYTNQVWYLQGFRNGLIAFTAAVLGGIGNVRGAALGGFLIGLIASICDLGFGAIFPALQDVPGLSWLTALSQQWTIVVIFALLILTLVFRPSGLLGEQVAEKA